MKIYAAAVTLLLTLVFLASGQTRGVSVRVKSNNGKTKEIRLYDASYALVIGNSRYTNGYDRLPGVSGDVIAVRDILKIHGFKVETVENLSGKEFRERVRKFIEDYGFDPNNRLLIYYAGHGDTLSSAGDKRDLGYLVPVDAPLPKRDLLGFKRKAIPMDDIISFAKRIESKHALFLFDSCFSGKLVSRSAIKVPPVIEENLAYAVRQFITAGSADQQVPDESIFRRTFVRALEGDGDVNKDGYITGTELAEYLKDKVTNYSNRSQTPQYGKINDVNLDRGDFVFAKQNQIITTNSNGSSVQSSLILTSIETYKAPPYPKSKDIEMEPYDYRLKDNSPIPPTLTDVLICDITVIIRFELELEPNYQNISLKMINDSMSIYKKYKWINIRGYRPWVHWNFINSLDQNQFELLAREILNYIRKNGVNPISCP